MSLTKNTLALILNRRPYRENDSLINVYTLEAGKQSLLARGAKKPQSKLAGQLEPINLVQLMIINSHSRYYIGGALVSNYFINIRSDLNKLYYAGQGLRIFDQLLREGQADSRLFFLLKNWLEFLDSFDTREEGLNKLQGELFLNFFLVRLLIFLGYQPEMNVCSFCQKKLNSSQNYFSFSSGGVVDSNCGQGNSLNLDSNAVIISNNCIKLLRFLISNDLEQVKQLKLSSKLLKELSLLINSFISFVF